MPTFIYVWIAHGVCYRTGNRKRAHIIISLQGIVNLFKRFQSYFSMMSQKLQLKIIKYKRRVIPNFINVLRFSIFWTPSLNFLAVTFLQFSSNDFLKMKLWRKVFRNMIFLTLGRLFGSANVELFYLNSTLNAASIGIPDRSLL